MLNEHRERGPFKVFLIHGRSDDWKKVKQFITEELRFKTQVLVEEYTGQSILTKIRQKMWEECDCAVAILSADDLLVTEERHARPNVLFEVGYCMGFFDYRYWEDDDIEPVILIIENGTEIPSDLRGVEYIGYHRRTRGGIKASFEPLQQGLERIYAQVKDYFED